MVNYGGESNVTLTFSRGRVVNGTKKVAQIKIQATMIGF